MAQVEVRLGNPMKTLLHEIVHCPHVESCLQNPSLDHPCREIVASQARQLDAYQVPEPWSGRIEGAPILFLSSNPSISSIEDYPTWSRSEEHVDDYFNHRFSGRRKKWIINGTKPLQTDGTYADSVHFWSAVRQRAIELLERDVTPGMDYALTEIVHCKSLKEFGVKQAQAKCVESYLLRVLEQAGAKVIVVMGARARRVIQNQFNISENLSVSEPSRIGSFERLITFLPHPNARKYRSFSKCLESIELERVRSFLR